MYVITVWFINVSTTEKHDFFSLTFEGDAEELPHCFIRTVTLHLMWGFACLQPVLLFSSWYLLQSFIHLLNPPSLVSFLIDLTCPHSTFQAAVCIQSCASLSGSSGTHSVSWCSRLSYAAICGILCAVHSDVFFPALNSCQIHVKCSGRCCLLREMFKFIWSWYSCQLFLFLLAHCCMEILMFRMGNGSMLPLVIEWTW